MACAIGLAGVTGPLAVSATALAGLARFAKTDLAEARSGRRGTHDCVPPIEHSAHRPERTESGRFNWAPQPQNVPLLSPSDSAATPQHSWSSVVSTVASCAGSGSNT